MKLLLPLSLFVLVFLPACVARNLPPSITDNPLSIVAAVEEPVVFAAEPGGRKVAVSKDGLSLVALDLNSSQKISSEQPLALAWNSDGSRLAAAYYLDDYVTRLLIYSSEGVLVRELALPVALTQLVWSARGDLLATGFELKVYSFGGNLRQSLYRIIDDDVEETLLSDSTLRPSLVAQLATDLSTLLPVTFSPYGDELIYFFLHDPPEFPPYLQVIYRNWQSAEDRPLLRVSLQKVSIFWSPSGDAVDILTKKGAESVRLWNSSQTVEEQPLFPGYRFIDGCLFQRRQLLADWGKGAQLQILTDGRFLLAVNKSLYMGAGLEPAKSATYNEKEWNLRRWRYEGLVTNEEYHKLIKENIQ